MQSTTNQQELYKMIRHSAMDLLMRREHSRQQLSAKLQIRYSNAQKIISEVIEQLQQEKLQSDSRFTEAFCRYRINKAQGPIKITYDLHQAGITDDLITNVLSQYSEQHLDNAVAALNKKFIPTDKSPATKAKALRFLSQRGFSQETAYTAWSIRHNSS